MKSNSILKHFKILFVLILIFTFFIAHINKISYGLPYFWNQDEIAFQSSILSSLSFLTGYLELNYNPFYGAFFNLIFILNSIFINEILINSLDLSQIKSKIYFNSEIFIFYGRLASLTISSFSIFVLYLIFKKLKISFFIYSVLLITFSTSMVLLNVSTIMQKNSAYLLIYLIQLYFFIKYLIKVNKFNFKSYLIFGILASLAWGVNYWPALVSIYAVLSLHFFKFKFSKINYLLSFSLVFILLGPVANSFFVGNSSGPLHWFTLKDGLDQFEINLFLKSIIEDVVNAFKILIFTEKNIFLLFLISPLFFLNKQTKSKKIFLIVLFLILEPIILFAVLDRAVPQLRYFAGVNTIILVLTALIFNELYKTSLKYISIVLLLFNSYIIFDNITKNNKINDLISQNHSFLNFNKNITTDQSKILYLVNLNFQESLKQNLYYVELYENDLIIKSERSKKFLKNIKKKIKIIKNTKNINIENKHLKENIIYFNYTLFQISDLKLFFDFIKKDFEYVVIEESDPYSLSDAITQKELKSYVKENFLLDHIQFKEDKIFLNNQQAIIHYFTDTITPYDVTENLDKDDLEVVYGINYSLYKFN